MTRTCKNFAILMVIVCLLTSMFSFSAFAASGANLVLNQATLTVAPGGTAQISASAQGCELYYYSMNNAIATVDASGVVTGVSEGNANVQVIAYDPAANTYQKGDLRVIVGALPEDFELTETASTVGIGSTYQIVARAKPSDEAYSSLTYVSTYEQMTVDKYGLVTVTNYAKPGTYTIKVTGLTTSGLVEKTLQLTIGQSSTTDLVTELMKNTRAPGPGVNTVINPSTSETQFTAGRTLLNQTGAFAANGWKTGWFADSAFSTPVSAAHGYVQIASTKYFENGADQDAVNKTAIVLQRDNQDLQTAYRQFTDAAAINFDLEGNAYYAYFYLNVRDTTEGSYAQVKIGDQIKISKVYDKDGGAKCIADFGTSNNMEAEYTGDLYATNEPTLALVKISTSAEGEDRVSVKFFGTRLSGNSEYVLTYTPDAWDYVLTEAVTGKATYQGLEALTRQDGFQFAPTFGEFYTKDAKTQIQADSFEAFTKSMSLEKGQQQPVIVQIFPTSASVKKYVFSSDDPSIATVNSKGVVTAVKEGTTKINVTAPDVTESENTATIDVSVYNTIATTSLAGTTTGMLVSNIGSPVFSAKTVPYISTQPSVDVKTLTDRYSFKSSNPDVISLNAENQMVVNGKGLSVLSASITNTLPNMPNATSGVVAFVAKSIMMKHDMNGDGYSSEIADRSGNAAGKVLKANGTAQLFDAGRSVPKGAAEAWIYDTNRNISTNTGITFGDGDKGTIFVGIDTASSLDYYTVTINGTKTLTNVRRTGGWNQFVVDRSVSGKTVVYINGAEAKTVSASHNGVSTITAIGSNAYYDDFVIYNLEGSAPVARDVKLTKSGDKVTLSYSFVDPDNDAEGDTLIEWYVSSGGSYKLNRTGTKSASISSLGGEKVKVSVTPIDSDGMRGETVESEVLTISSSSGDDGDGWDGGIIVNPTNPTPTPPVIPTPNAPFVDVAGHWAENDINSMKAKGLLSGYSDNTFQPENSITRAEFVKMIVGAIGLSPAAYTNSYADVESGVWYATYIQAASNAGIVSGSDGMFRPNDLITREEMSKAIMSAYVYKTGNEMPAGNVDQFADKDQISGWAVPYIGAATELGFIKGMTETTFVPQANATRAQAATIMCRLYNTVQ